MTTTNNITSCAATQKEPVGLYLHIPFCVRKCNYCDFLSFPEKTAGEALRQQYVGCLCREILAYGGDGLLVDTVFFGGGTPSLLSPAQAEQIFCALSAAFSIAEDAEITMEVNPGTVDYDKLAAYRSLGVNRLSLGIQSMDDEILSYLGRIHNRKQAEESFCLARKAGFDNLNCDLIFGIPGQSPDSFSDTTEQIFSMGPEHLSFYSLQLEEGTPFYDWFSAGTLIPAAEETDRAMYHRLLSDLSDHGYIHYEISNAAKPGRECRHNLKYWSMKNYLGLGLAAHSYMDGLRFFNTSDLPVYFRAFDAKEETGAASGAVAGMQKNTRDDSITDYLFTELRLLSGIELADFENRFGEPLEARYPEAVSRFLMQGLLWKRDGRIGFTERGLDFTNTVLRELMAAEERNR